MQQDLVPATGGLAQGAFAHQRYTIKRPWLTFFGRTFHVFAPDGRR